MAAKKTLDEKAVLVRLKRSRWWGRKTDKAAGISLCSVSSANAEMVSVSKFLVSESALSEVNSLYTRVYQYHKQVTLAWSDDSYRMLPMKEFTSYVQSMNEFKIELDQITDDLVKIYPDLVKAGKGLLGDLYDENEYPSPDEIKGAFRLGINYRPIPVRSDFRIDLSESDQTELTGAFEAELNENLKMAVQDIWGRIKETLEHVHTILAGDRQVRAALLGNVNIMLDTVSRLNITDDENVKKVVRDIKAKVIQYDTETLRENKSAKTEVKNATKEILDSMSSFMG